MNWQELKDKYPKVFLTLTTYFGVCEYAPGQGLNRWGDTSDELQLGHVYYPQKLKPNVFLSARDLYDFLDREGVYVNIRVNQHGVKWSWEIVTDPNIHATILDAFDGRKEAEHDAFMASFEILNKR